MSDKPSGNTNMKARGWLTILLFGLSILLGKCFQDHDDYLVHVIKANILTTMVFPLYHFNYQMSKYLMVYM